MAFQHVPRAAQGPPPDPAIEIENHNLSLYLMTICGGVGAVLLIWHLYSQFITQVRTVVCLNNEKQQFFAYPNSKLSWVKRNLLYAPIFRKRHNRELQMSSAINMGTLPTRLEFVLLIGYFATNVAFCLIGIPFTEQLGTAASRFRNRTGILSVINMIPLFLLAGRNNPFIPLLNISFDQFNLLHRWLGRIVVLEALAHTVAHMWKNTAAKGSAAAWAGVWAAPFLLYGFIATLAFVIIAIQASSAFRHAFYETFKVLHIALAIASIVGLWYHLDLAQLPQLSWLIAAIALWAFDRAMRLISVAYRNFGKGGTRTVIETLPGNALRISVTVARPWTFRSGQHAYLYFPSLGYWQSHPFSVAWAAEAVDTGAEKLAMTRQDVLSAKKSTISFIVRERTGITNTLYKKAISSPGGRLETKCFVEGPYGAMHSLQSYGTVMLFAGGVGISHQVPYVRELVAGFANGTVATRKLVLVWTIQSPEHLEWIRPWMTEILAMERRREILRVMLFVSRPRSTKEIHSPSATVQMFPGRPNIETLVGIETESQVGAMAVTVCGPGTLSDEVRRAVRNRMDNTSIDFIEEAFTW
ncbi:related to ferric-chelate reductase [Cephalotrichum gorgonifer]|uniref:Related to ferric-chelate reductase n=1 Tax=Cephalotrichum gorgonifer TaxID=2041049 RepID=A0AAE8SVF9_9PEZI|nr:related to ferric-chelate reductase [Cephalotrichum gorgonifer]